MLTFNECMHEFIYKEETGTKTFNQFFKTGLKRAKEDGSKKRLTMKTAVEIKKASESLPSFACVAIICSRSPISPFFALISVNFFSK